MSEPDRRTGVVEHAAVRGERNAVGARAKPSPGAFEYECPCGISIAPPRQTMYPRPSAHGDTGAAALRPQEASSGDQMRTAASCAAQAAVSMPTCRVCG
jgi:hypothetical protein